MLQDDDYSYEDPPNKKPKVSKKEKDLQKALADKDLLILKLQQQQQQPPPITPIKSEPIVTAATVISPPDVVSKQPACMPNQVNSLSTAEAFLQSRLLAAELKKSYDKASMEKRKISC